LQQELKRKMVILRSVEKVPRSDPAHMAIRDRSQHFGPGDYLCVIIVGEVFKNSSYLEI